MFDSKIFNPAFNWSERAEHNLAQLRASLVRRWQQRKLRAHYRKVVATRSEMQGYSTDEIDRLAGLWKNPPPRHFNLDKPANPLVGVPPSILDRHIGVGNMSTPAYGDLTRPSGRRSSSRRWTRTRDAASRPGSAPALPQTGHCRRRGQSMMQVIDNRPLSVGGLFNFLLFAKYCS